MEELCPGAKGGCAGGLAELRHEKKQNDGMGANAIVFIGVFISLLWDHLSVYHSIRGVMWNYRITCSALMNHYCLTSRCMFK